MKLSSSLDELNEQFKNHGKDYLSLMELCDQAVQAPKRARKKMKKARTKFGSTSHNSLNSDFEASITTPKRIPPSPAKKVNNWRMSLCDTTNENFDAAGVRISSAANNADR